MPVKQKNYYLQHILWTFFSGRIFLGRQKALLFEAELHKIHQIKSKIQNTSGKFNYSINCTRQKQSAFAILFKLFEIINF